MKNQIRNLEQQSGIEIYGLGKDRAKWEASLEKFAELIAQECIRQIVKIPTRVEYLGGQSFTYIQLGETVETIKVHFGVE